MIKGNENISELFSIFHDGVISAYCISEDNIKLEIDISYLTERIDQNYTKFFLSLHNVRHFSFKTWLRDINSDTVTIRYLSKIFIGNLEILSSEMKNESIEVLMSQHSDDYNYSGGALSFKADAAQVTDEGGKQYNISELEQICEDYWSEWSSRNKR